MNVELDEAGNLRYNAAGLVYTDGEPQFLQDLATRLRLLPGEYVLRPGDGVEWNYEDLNSIVTKELLRDPRTAYLEIKQVRLPVGSTLEVHVKYKGESHGN